MPSPVRHKRHSRPHNHLSTWLGYFEASTPGTEAGDNGSIRLDLDNEPQPDAYLIIDPKCGGQVRFSDDDYVEGVPELVAEVASSTVSYDLGRKLHVYRRNGVREYVVWVLDNEVDWFVLREGRFEAMARDADGIFRSTVYPGLWLDPGGAPAWRPGSSSCRLATRPQLARARRLRNQAGACKNRSAMKIRPNVSPRVALVPASLP